MVLLKGERVRLRPLEPDDMKDFFHRLNDPEAAGEYDAFGIESWAEFEKDFKETGDPHEFTMLIIERNEDRSKLGLVAHYLSHPVMHNVEIGFQIWEPSERNKGHCSEAVKLLVVYLFTTKSIARVQATTNILNKPAQRVLEKCGFAKEGQLRKALFAGGRFQDMYIYGVTREEWERQKP
jgi:aminoglycoside 6'-N-acetyltransferase